MKQDRTSPDPPAPTSEPTPTPRRRSRAKWVWLFLAALLLVLPLILPALAWWLGVLMLVLVALLAVPPLRRPVQAVLGVPRSRPVAVTARMLLIVCYASLLVLIGGKMGALFERQEVANQEVASIVVDAKAALEAGNVIHAQRLLEEAPYVQDATRSFGSQALLEQIERSQNRSHVKQVLMALPKSQFEAFRQEEAVPAALHFEYPVLREQAMALARQQIDEVAAERQRRAEAKRAQQQAAAAVRQRQADAEHARQEAAVKAPPAAPSYQILKVDKVPGIKASLTIRLDQRVSASVLENLAHKLREELSGDYRRVFITYYLPDMPVGSGAWATSRFDPDLKVRILGATIEQAEHLRQDGQEAPSAQRLGVWLDEQPYVTSRITIIREGEDWKLRQRFKDGSTRTADLRMQEAAGERRFFEKGSAGGDYYVINATGDLEIRDARGLITTAEAID